MIEANNIYNMDCLEGMKMMNDNSVDVSFTSPPYNDTGGQTKTFQIVNTLIKSIFMLRTVVIGLNGNVKL